MAKHSGSSPDSREQLAEAIREEKSLSVCAKHFRTVYYDGKICPACQAEQEFRNLTRGMLYSNPTKPVDRKGGKP